MDQLLSLYFNPDLMQAWLGPYTVPLSSYICEECSERFKTSKGLEIHKNKIHPKSPNQFSCSKCSKSFKSKNLLKSHQNQVHDKATRILCSKCEKYFCNKAILAKHIKVFHPSVVSIN